ncbi:hypothetical protein BVY02_02480 [bacterium J17]|nr:hypothetical protein BVY02_02480 [bacterium J17]
MIERTKAGDNSAFRVLVERYQARALAVAIGVIGHREDAEDIVQDAFVKAHRNLSSFRGKSSFYTWLYRIVFNLAVDLSRKKYRQVEKPIGDSVSLDSGKIVSAVGRAPLLAKLSSPDEELDRAELGQKIEAALDTLSAEHRAVIVLREIEGLSYAEISKVVGCNKGTVMSRLFHARKRLQKELTKYLSS